MPKQEMRSKSVRRKLNPVSYEFKGKNILLIDDSIVRGTTSKQIVEMVRKVGAKKVYFASAAPPVRFQNFGPLLENFPMFLSGPLLKHFQNFACWECRIETFEDFGRVLRTCSTADASGVNFKFKTAVAENVSAQGQFLRFQIC